MLKTLKSTLPPKILDRAVKAIHQIERGYHIFHQGETKASVGAPALSPTGKYKTMFRGTPDECQRWIYEQEALRIAAIIVAIGAVAIGVIVVVGFVVATRRMMGSR